MKKEITVLLRVVVEDLTDAERSKCAKEMGCDVSELPTLKDIELDQLTGILANIGVGGYSELLFEGSEIYANFTNVEVGASSWRDCE